MSKVEIVFNFFDPGSHVVQAGQELAEAKADLESSTCRVLKSQPFVLIALLMRPWRPKSGPPTSWAGTLPAELQALGCMLEIRSKDQRQRALQSNGCPHYQCLCLQHLLLCHFRGQRNAADHTVTDLVPFKNLGFFLCVYVCTWRKGTTIHSSSKIPDKHT